MTYNKILENMKDTFYEKCGENVELMSDIGARFQAVASELFSLYCYGEFILKQAFVQSASGKYLDYHAQMRDNKRKTSSSASGELVFSIPEELTEDIEIAKGTICAVADSPYIQFSTTENAVIKAGDTSVNVQATAIEDGSDYNVSANCITVMVNAPLGVGSVTNPEEFQGGCDDEKDESLRKRLLSSYRVPPTGVSPESIAESIMKFDGVLDCHVENIAGKYITAFLITKSMKYDDKLIEDIQNQVMITQLVNLPLEVYIAEPKKFDLNVDVTVAKGTSEQVEEEIRQTVVEFTDALKIGETLNIAKLSCIISKIDSVEYCEISSNGAIHTSIVCNNQSFLKLRKLAVNCYEE
jgi:uncharacterized phage protein gp47/JayE